jgi:hypothetical protein
LCPATSPIEAREITAFHLSSLSLNWCELVRKHVFPKPESALDIRCWLIAAREIKEAGKKLDALHLPSDALADYFLRSPERKVDAFNARVLRAVHGDKNQANFLERVAEAVSGTVSDGKLDILATAILVYPEVYNRLGRAPTEDELRKATKARWKKPISDRTWRNVQREMKDLLQKPGELRYVKTRNCVAKLCAAGSASSTTFAAEYRCRYSAIVTPRGKGFRFFFATLEY